MSSLAPASRVSVDMVTSTTFWSQRALRVQDAVSSRERHAAHVDLVHRRLKQRSRRTHNDGLAVRPPRAAVCASASRALAAVRSFFVITT